MTEITSSASRKVLSSSALYVSIHVSNLVKLLSLPRWLLTFVIEKCLSVSSRNDAYSWLQPILISLQSLIKFLAAQYVLVVSHWSHRIGWSLVIGGHWFNGNCSFGNISVFSLGFRHTIFGSVHITFCASLEIYNLFPTNIGFVFKCVIQNYWWS